ncbi:enoyl-CoA hydratase [Aestuariibius sp. HNIBRBA575]|uniref:enoyl-CoA hydratase n=1 Tax=Aestuariibius sp. HNIBRBA575 TaxID=3233343 RepID=UPI0034A37920
MSLLEIQTDGAVTHIKMAMPKRLNALSDAMLAALQSTLTDIGANPDIRVVILSGKGKAFCAGHDLKEMQAGRDNPDGGAAYFKDLFDRCTTVMQTIQSIPQPVIAMPHGIATAAGCQLVATCDMAVAAEGTRFGVNGVNIGLFCSTPMVALTRNIHRKAAFEMLSTGKFVTTNEALRIGLINRIAPADQLLDLTMELAQNVASKLGSAVRIGKSLFYEQAGLPTEQAYALAGQAMVENMLLRDTDEGINAFLDKRQPDWA